MDEIVARKLVDLNKDFYERFAAPFSESRAFPHPGFDRLLEYIPPVEPTVLDIGCGNGRFGRYLMGQGISAIYTGVDFSVPLMDEVRDIPGRFINRDLSRLDCLLGLEKLDFIVCLSTLQHIPGQANRGRLVREMSEHLRPGCYLALANWQFLDSPRQRRKILPWSSIGLTLSDVEEGDYLLSWDRGGAGMRYVAYLDAEAIKNLAVAANLRVVNQHLSDGREGILNLYSILAG